MIYAYDSAGRFAAGRLGFSLASTRLARVTACALAALSSVGAAAAADVEDSFLRGSLFSRSASPSYANWDGLYFGGQFGVSSGSTDFGSGVASLTNYILRDSVLQNTVANLTTMGKESSNRTSYGGFLGYNFPYWDQIVLGLEVNYNRINMEANATDALTRIINNDAGAPVNHHYFYTTTVTGSASVRITDYATMRARAAYKIGQFLPYAFLGGAIGRANYARTAAVGYTTEDKPDTTIPVTVPDPPPNFNSPLGSNPAGTKSEAQSNVFAYGITAGLGIDVSILPNMFLRAEWEYVQFSPIHDIKVSINTGRVGLGVKF